LFAICGVLVVTGVLENAIDPVRFLAYTVQSNIWAALMFGVLAVRTIATPKGESYGFYPRIEMIVTHAIFITMLVFWFILAPLMASSIVGLFTSFENMAVHLITPLLMLIDYLVFTKRGELKPTDPLLCLIIPYVYIAQAMALGLTHSVFYDSPGNHSYYPYSFMDVDLLGAWVIPILAGLTVFFLGIAFLWRWVDGKLK
jgi:hypothetical protein